MNSFHKLHGKIATLVDWCSCELINLLHSRHSQESTTLELLENLKSEIQDQTPESFFLKVDLSLEYHPQQGPARLRFASPFKNGVPENDVAVCDFFPAADTWERPLMFLLHGLMSVSDVGYRSWAKRMNHQGWHVMFIHLPYHYARTPRGRISGELTLGPNGTRNIHALRQAVTEVRSLASWAVKQGVPQWGLLGMSYGGWVGAILACLEVDAAPLLLIEPPVDFQHAIWESPASRTIRKDLLNNGLTPELIKQIDHLVSPVALQPKCSNRRITLYGGEFDRICPPKLIQQLASKWECECKIFPQGHVGYRLMREAYSDWLKFSWTFR